MNFCPECGYKVESNFKFRPNCGSKIESGINPISESQEDTSEFTICKNCGEENSIENSACFSCGVPLNVNKLQKKNRQKPEIKKNDKRNSVSEKNTDNRKVIKDEKVLDNKKILIILSTIVIVFVFALIASGVFDSGTPTSLSQMNNQSTNSGSVDLTNMEEINQLESKVSADPEDLESALHLAHLQQDAGLSEKAIANYKKYLTKFPENADARVDMAICYYNVNDYNTAISEMETAINYQPKHQIAYLNLGIVNLAAKNIEASKEWFNKTVELDPNSEAGKRAQELLHSH